MYIYSVIYSTEYNIPEFVSLYLEYEDAMSKMIETLNAHEGYLQKVINEQGAYIRYKDRFNSLCLYREEVNKILSDYYVILYWYEDGGILYSSLHETLDEARYIVENKMDHECSIVQDDEVLIWNNSCENKKSEIIMIQKITVSK